MLGPACKGEGGQFKYYGRVLPMVEEEYLVPCAKDAMQPFQCDRLQ